MSRLTGPLMSMGARGQIGETLVFSRWKGRPYARQYVVPANPQTSGQTTTRNTFAALNAIWRYMPAAAIDAWALYAQNSQITSRNAWIKQNLSAVRGDADLQDIVLSPSAGSGLVADAISVTPSAGQLDVTLTAPPLPTGWTIAQAVAVALKDDDPQALGTPEVTAGTDATDPYVISLTGLTGSALHVVGGWFEFTKPDGSSAYGQSLQTTATPS